jgi:hypothetical protein
MAGPVPMVVQTGIWIGTAYAEGSLFIRAGTVVDVVPGSALATQYGGSSNLAPLAAGESGDDADHAALGN